MRVPILRGQIVLPPSLPQARLPDSSPGPRTARSLIFLHSKLTRSIQTAAEIRSMERLRSPWPATYHSTTPLPSPRPQPPSKLREVTVQKEVGMPFRLLRTSLCFYAHTRAITIDQNCWKESRISHSFNLQMKWQTFYGSQSSYRRASML